MLNEFMTEDPYPSALVEQTMVRGEPHELDLVRRAYLVENVGQVSLHGVRADRESARDFLVRVAAEYRAHDLELPPRQAKRLRLPAGCFQLANTRGHVHHA